MTILFVFFCSVDSLCTYNFNSLLCAPTIFCSRVNKYTSAANNNHASLLGTSCIVYGKILVELHHGSWRPRAPVYTRHSHVPREPCMRAAASHQASQSTSSICGGFPWPRFRDAYISGGGTSVKFPGTCIIYRAGLGQIWWNYRPGRKRDR
jgi:hypothetical protein